MLAVFVIAVIIFPFIVSYKGHTMLFNISRQNVNYCVFCAAAIMVFFRIFEPLLKLAP